MTIRTKFRIGQRVWTVPHGYGTPPWSGIVVLIEKRRYQREVFYTTEDTMMVLPESVLHPSRKAAMAAVKKGRA